MDHATLDRLAPFCDEFLIHAADVEGLCRGIDAELVALLGNWGKSPVTYAGGAATMADLLLVEQRRTRHGGCDGGQRAGSFRRQGTAFTGTWWLGTGARREFARKAVAGCAGTVLVSRRAPLGHATFRRWSGDEPRFPAVGVPFDAPREDLGKQALQPLQGGQNRRRRLSRPRPGGGQRHARHRLDPRHGFLRPADPRPGGTHGFRRADARLHPHLSRLRRRVRCAGATATSTADGRKWACRR